MIRAAAITGVVCIVALAACGGDDSSSSASPSTKKAGSSTTTVAPDAKAACAQADPAELEAKVAIEVPAGFEQQTDDVGDTGPSDLDKAVRDDGGKKARAELVADGFRRGYQRLWVDGQDDELIVFLYEFCDNDGATKYRDGGIADITAEGLAKFDTVGITDSVGYSGTAEDATVAVVSTVSGPYGIHVIADGSTDVALTDLQTLAATATASVIKGLPPAH
jgi:hypothetical protein